MATKKSKRVSKKSTVKKKQVRKAPAKRKATARAIPAAEAVPEIGSEAVEKATGHGWEQWFEILDADKAHEMSHKDIAVLLYEKHGVNEWWCQMVTVGYERARGMREKHQVAGGYQVSVSRTMGVSAAGAFKAWNDARVRAKWLSEEVTIRKATPNRTLRITWSDGTSVEVYLWSKGAKKTQVVVQHSKLKDAAAGERMKKFWAGRLVEMEEKVQSSNFKAQL